MNYMGQSKRDYMESHDGLADRYYNIILEKIQEEEMFYKTLCDTRPYIKE